MRIQTVYEWSLVLSVCAWAVLSSCARPSGGPLRVSDINPRYFTDAGGKAILLTGSHTWNNLVDMGPTDPPPAFDFDKQLDWMERYGHNFMRMWTWELLTWDTSGNSPNTRKEATVNHSQPHPYARTGPGTAIDGKPKFNLTQYDPEYFQRLRTRLEKAAARGIYVSIMLFEGWGLQFSPNAWAHHPFHPANNINSITANINGDSSGVEVHELVSPDVLALQEAYVKKIIETVNDLDNVLYEISNENHPPSTLWQYHIITFIHDVEKSLPKQHPVGMTFQFKGGSNADLFQSPAEWISPNRDGGYRDNPPAADGSKVILSDTDHLGGIWGNQGWVWKSFCRGLNPIFMDPYERLILGSEDYEKWEPVRNSMGYIRRYAERMDLVHMTPQNGLSSTGYCLAHVGTEYLTYLPEGGSVTIDLTGVSGPLQAEWFNPNSNETTPGTPVNGGRQETLTSPFGGVDAVVYLYQL